MEEVLKYWNEYKKICKQNYKNGYTGSATPSFEEFMIWYEAVQNS